MQLNPKKWFYRLSLTSILAIAMLYLSSINVYAEDSTSAACSEDLNVTFTKLFNPGNFIPIIPEPCSSGSELQPLRLDLLPNILARGYAFIASIAMYLFTFSFVYWGIVWITGGFTMTESDGGRKVKNNYRKSVTALIIILIINLIIIELLEALGVEDIRSMDFFNG